MKHPTLVKITNVDEILELVQIARTSVIYFQLYNNICYIVNKCHMLNTKYQTIRHLSLTVKCIPLQRPWLRFVKMSVKLTLEICVCPKPTLTPWLQSAKSSRDSLFCLSVRMTDDLSALYIGIGTVCLLGCFSSSTDK